MAVGWIFPLRLLKYIFGLSTIGGAVLLIRGIIHWSGESAHEDPLNLETMIEDLVMNFETINMSNHMKCIRSPSREFCFLTQSKQVVRVKKTSPQVDSNSAAANGKTSFHGVHNPVYDTIRGFCVLMETFSIPVILIEPTILFCMLNDELQNKLLMKEFDLPSVIGSANVITFGVHHSDSLALDLALVRDNLEFDGFKTYKIQTNRVEMLKDSRNVSVISHYFFSRRLIFIHVVVFFKRGHYLWHTEAKDIPSELKGLLPTDRLLFVESEGIFEKFGTRILESNELRESTNFSIPSNPSHFLWQIQSSRFVRCKEPRQKTTDGVPADLGAVFYVLNALKAAVWSYYMHFVLFKVTLSDWSKDCMTLGLSKKLELAAKASDLTGLELELTLRSYLPCSKNMQVYGSPENAYEIEFVCFGINVHLYFLYEMGGVYVLFARNLDLRDDGLPDEDSPTYYRYVYPKFDICSSEVFGYKVTVPCNTEDILSLEDSTE